MSDRQETNPPLPALPPDDRPADCAEVEASSSPGPAIERWREAQLARSRFSVRQVDFAQVPQWSLRDGRLQHASGGFFSVVGLTFRDRHSGAPAWQPFILQPEIGILGFLLTRRDGDIFLLVQAKTEPGNHGGTQLSPSFQCTESNYRRLHGGSVAPFHAYFAGPGADARVLADSLQSEQGTRFVDKYNRNLLVEIPPDAIDLDRPEHAAWRWVRFSALRDLIVSDLLFNTDARSVLAVAPWESFCPDERPFARWAAAPGFGHELWRSYGLTPTSARLAQLHAWLESRRRAFSSEAAVVPLDSLPGWSLAPAGLTCTTGTSDVAVHYYAVQAEDREVPRWAQPLVTSATEGAVVLVAQVREGVLRFLTRVSPEPGFANSAQLAPSFQDFPGAPRPRVTDPAWLEAARGQATVLLDSRMSEEGGRFYLDLNRYRLVLASPAVEFPEDPDQCWLTLGEITAWKATPGTFTNEFRSALSLLLHYL